MNKPLLTILLPTYNRYKLLKRLFESIDYFSDEIELIIIDDNSTDNSKNLINSIKKNINPIRLKYLKNDKNLGRAPSLQKGLNEASGIFSMFMDSDDYFIKNGINNIIEQLKILTELNYPLNIQGLVFGCKFKNYQTDFSKIANCTLTDFTNLRIKYLKKGDLKEVFNTELIRQVDYSKVLNSHRRIPTRLLLDRMSSLCKVLIITKLVVYKTYQENGLTSQLKYNSFLKREMLPQLLFYRDLLFSKSYTSIKYRFLILLKTIFYCIIFFIKELLIKIRCLTH